MIIVTRNLNLCEGAGSRLIEVRFFAPEKTA